MARRSNTLFIGTDYLNVEGRTQKHPALISTYGTASINKISDTPIKLIGLDAETNHKTAQLKLLGFYDGEQYSYHLDNFIAIIFAMVKKCYWNKEQTALAYWNKLDPFIIFKQFVMLFPPLKQKRALSRYGKIGGEWNRDEGKWSITPVIEVEIKRGYKTYRFGITNVIRSSIQFFYYEMDGAMPKSLDNGKYPLSTVWAFDIANLFKSGLEAEALGKYDEETQSYPNARLPYYSKLGIEYHLVDWDRFETDADYRKGVLYSNELDARAVYDLGNYIQKEFKEAFGYYSKTLISTGSLARASILATIMYNHGAKLEKGKIMPDHARKKVTEDMKSIGILNYLDGWSKQLGEEKFKDMYCMLTESYSGGYIEAIRYGKIKSGFYADIASAYPANIKELYDLRGCKITAGVGSPPHIKYSYCFVRGTVDIPDGVNYMPLTVKHPSKLNKDTNIRATGIYKASYTLEERDFLIELGATFTDETWYNFETTGKLSPIASVVSHFVELRNALIAVGNSAEYMAKIAVNSAYGILFEAVDTYDEAIDQSIQRQGYRAGEFYNPLFASIVTARTRILISKAVCAIEDNGGKPVLIMTDAIFWEGKASQMPAELVRDVKTLGYFESPQAFSEMASLGTGRYSYIDNKYGKMTTKNRGLNVVDFHRPDGIEIGEYDWLEALNVAERTNSLEIGVKVRKLVSVGLILSNHKYDIKDLGLIVNETTDVDLVTGLTKRFLNVPKADIEKNVKLVTQGNIMTRCIYLDTGMYGNGKMNDQTLPVLRGELMKLEFKTAKGRDKQNRSKASNKYNKNNREKINEMEKTKYKMLKDLGHDRNTCKKWCKRSWERINTELIGGN